MSTPINPTDWLATCPDLLEGLVDAVRICSLQVAHPLCLRKNQRPLSCRVGCNNSRNLHKLSSELVKIVIDNPHYIKILHWHCQTCSSPNIGSLTCTTFPADPFRNSPLFNILAKVFSNFFKSLVTLISSNPPTNYAPQRVTKFSLIVTILTSHGLKWHALLLIDFKLAYRCSCKVPTASTPTESPPNRNKPNHDHDDDDDLLLLDLSTESLYEVTTFSTSYTSFDRYYS